MPALTQFIDGTGPVFAGSLFPFLFITIACGAVSGWHCADRVGHDAEAARQRKGRAPHRLRRDAGGGVRRDHGADRRVRAGPGRLFRDERAGRADRHERRIARRRRSAAGASSITPETLAKAASDIGETTILSRAGGAPTLAVGMARDSARVLSLASGMLAFWYHYAILFEALFILTTVDAGTRVGRFMIQELAGLRRAVAEKHRIVDQRTSSRRRSASVAGAGSSIRASSIRSAASTRCGRCSASRTRCSPRSR